MTLITRTYDEEAIRRVLVHQDIADNIGVTENPDFRVPINDDIHYLLMEGGLFILHEVEDGWEMHVNVLKDYRDKAHQGAAEMLEYAFNELGASKVVCYIPQRFKNVYNFALSFNMNDEGLKNGDHYLTLRYDQWALSEE